MNLNEIQKTILKSITEKFAATKEIRRHVFDDLEQTVSDEAFYTALFCLHSTGFVASYIYDNQSKDYALINSPDEYSIDALHWLAVQEAGSLLVIY